MWTISYDARNIARAFSQYSSTWSDATALALRELLVTGLAYVPAALFIDGNIQRKGCGEVRRQLSKYR